MKTEYAVISTNGEYSLLAVFQGGKAVYVAPFYFQDGESLAQTIADIHDGCTPADWEGNEINENAEPEDVDFYNSLDNTALGDFVDKLGGRVECVNGMWLADDELSVQAKDARFYLMNPKKLRTIKDCELYAERVLRASQNATERHAETMDVLRTALSLMRWWRETWENNIASLNAIASREGASISVICEDANGDECHQDDAVNLHVSCENLSMHTFDGKHENDGSDILHAIARGLRPEAEADELFYSRDGNFESLDVKIK